MNNSSTPQATIQDLIITQFEQEAARIAGRYQDLLREATKAHRRERYVNWFDYGEDDSFFAIVASEYALRGECVPEEMSNDDYRAIVGQHYDRLTDRDVRAFEKEVRQEKSSWYFDDHFYSDEVIGLRDQWGDEIGQLESRLMHEPRKRLQQEIGSMDSDEDREKRSALWEQLRVFHDTSQISKTKDLNHPFVFHCNSCNQLSYSHDETGTLISMVSALAATTGETYTYLICENCIDHPDTTIVALSKLLAEAEEYHREQALLKDAYLDELFSDMGIDPDAGDPIGSQSTASTGSQQSAQPKTAKLKSENLIDALKALGMPLRLNRLEDNVEVDGKRLDDITLSEINLKLVDDGFSRPNIADGINVLAGRNVYDPIEDYLLGLKWDGHNHLADLMKYITGDGRSIKYSGQDVPLHASLIVRWLTGAVARGLGRGVGATSHQTPMLVLIGPQGIGKSFWVRWLASGVGYEYYRESMVNPHGIEDMRSMVTKWIWEVSELGSSLRRGDRDSLKAFITQEWHTYRKPWGKHQITKPTLCNFVGTLNPETGFLDDPTGHRRFLPVVINAIDHGYKDAIDVNQLWAQVVSMYQEGKIFPQLNPEETNALKSVYEEHEVENPLATYINMYFDVVPSNTAMRCHTAVIMQRLQAFEIKLANNPKQAGRDLNDVLVPMGLNNGGGKPFRVGGVLGRGWIGIQPNAIPTP